MLNNTSKKQFKTPASRAKRFLKLAGMSASVASEYAAQKIRGKIFPANDPKSQQHKSYYKMANEIADTLGELKGAVMKIGQIVSQTQDFLPQEFSEALQRLQQQAPPMDFAVIRQQITRELGSAPEDLFAEFDAEPFAAASIGQVHRAVTNEGREVIVKVQYPGIDRSVDSDLKQLRLTLKLGGLLKLPKACVDQLFEEIKIRLKEELDYEHEARNIGAFRQFHQGDKKLIIPSVLADFSSRRVLTLEYVAGDHITNVSTDRYSQQTINQIGRHLFRVMADQLFDLQMIHGDPHAGNFAFRPDGTVIIYDFGCVKKLKPEIIIAYRKALVAGIAEDYSALDSHLVDLGLRIKGMPAVDEHYYATVRKILMEPFADTETLYHFGGAKLHQQLAAKAPLFFNYMHFFQPPVETIFIDRMIAGHYWIMKKLAVQAAFRSEIEHYLRMSH